MAKSLISFPSAAMVVPDGEWEAVGRDAHAVIDEAKAAGVYVFGGGIDEDVPPVLVSADGSVADGGYPWAPRLDGGFTVLELPSREEAVAWAARIAKACRGDQELRGFGLDRKSWFRVEPEDPSVERYRQHGAFAVYDPGLLTGARYVKVFFLPPNKSFERTGFSICGSLRSIQRLRPAAQLHFRSAAGSASG